jgi:hypothetical protein
MTATGGLKLREQWDNRPVVAVRGHYRVAFLVYLKIHEPYGAITLLC